MKVVFVTFGCRLNRAESLDLEARYRAAGHEIIDLGGPRSYVATNTGGPRCCAAENTGGPRCCAADIPDLILVRGCSVTAKAQRDCEKAIAHLHTRFPTSEIRTLGCLPNAQAGSVPLENIPVATGRARSPSAPQSHLSTAVSARPPYHLSQPPSPSILPPVPMQTSRAYLKIQDGCNGKCAFCIVPHFRGAPVSVQFDEITVRMKSYLAAGYREIILTGCNLSLYHSGNHNLASLLAALAELGSVPQTGGPRCRATARIRIGSLEPGPLCEDILDVMADRPNICRFLHLSLQSGSDHILKRMNRPYEIMWAERFCTMARERLGPDLALGADIITGFPGETEEDFEATRAFLKRHAFSNLHVFPYSERPGTPAATMDGALPRSVRLVRARNLTALGRIQRAAFAQTFLGREVEVCVERGGEHGWTDSYLPCKWKGPAERRSLVRKRVVAVNGDTLLA